MKIGKSFTFVEWLRMSEFSWTKLLNILKRIIKCYGFL